MAGRRGGRARGAKTAGRPSSNPKLSDEGSENEDVEQADSPSQDNSNESSEKEGSDNEGSKGKTSSKNSESGDKESEGEKSDEEKSPAEAVLPDKPVITRPRNVTFECSMCFFTTDNEDNFLKHMEELHRRDLGFWCKSCGTAYESALQLIEHVKEYCDKIKHFQHACGFPDCEFKTTEPANLIFHFRNEHKGKYLFPCGQCEQQFTILTSLVLHQQDKCMNKHLCSLVSGSTGPKAPSEADKKKDSTNPTDDRFRCALCTFETTQRNMFVEHHTDLHSRDLCCCKRCGKVVKNADNLINHISENNCSPNKYSHPCGHDGCEFTSPDPLAYRNHIRNGHPRTSLQKCDGCKKQFTIIPLLLMHMQGECSELNTEGREQPPSNGNNASGDTINNVVLKAATTVTAEAPTTGRGSRGGQKKSSTPKRGGGPGSRGGRGRGSAAKSASAGRGVKRRVTREKTPGSSDESDADEPPAPTPSRSSGRAAAKKRVSYANSSHSDDDY